MGVAGSRAAGYTPGCRAIAMAFRSGQVTEATRVIKKLGMVRTIESVLVVVTTVAMIYKWGVG